jgi:hypothetical protein
MRVVRGGLAGLPANGSRETPGLTGAETQAMLRPLPKQCYELLRCAERPQMLNHLGLATMNRPIERRALPDCVLDIQPRAPLRQEPHHGCVTR